MRTARPRARGAAVRPASASSSAPPTGRPVGAVDDADELDLADARRARSGSATANAAAAEEDGPDRDRAARPGRSRQGARRLPDLGVVLVAARRRRISSSIESR